MAIAITMAGCGAPDSEPPATLVPASAPERTAAAGGSPGPARASAQRTSDGSGATIGSYADAVSRVAPAVVTIHSARRVRAPQQFPFLSDPRFRDFFGGPRGEAAPRSRGQQVRGLGSGVIVTADGYCLTNHHVIDGAEEITAETTDRRTFRANLIGSDPPSDLAVIKLDARDLPRLTLGDSERVRVGDIALAIGNPLGVGQTVTAGIISAKGRYTGLSDGSFEDFLQTDAPSNQGNSGGALVNAQGELVGINSQILSTSGGNIGIGFAIPSNMARNVMQQPIDGGRVRRGQLGVIVEPVTPEIAAEANRQDSRGVRVRDVVPGGPAEVAGVRPGDLILAINGTTIEEGNTLRIHVASSRPGEQVRLTLWRNGRERQVRATLAELAMPRRT